LTMGWRMAKYWPPDTAAKTEYNQENDTT
jgi:hypothetical protein